MKNKKDRQTLLEFDITALAAGGDGVARLEGRTYYVPFTAPGDRVIARFTTSISRTVQTELHRIVAPSKARTTPPCPLFEICGGCDWLHIAYQTQLAAKTAFLSRALQNADIEVIASPLQLGYRRLARLHLLPLRNGRSVLGFTVAHGNRIIDVTRCPILDPSLNEAISPLKNGPLRHLTLAAEVVLCAGAQGVFAHIRSGQSLPESFYEEARSLCPAHLAGIEVESENIRGLVAGTDLVSVPSTDGGVLRFPVSSFGQANEGINQLLIGRVLQWIEQHGPFERALELFAGAGNISVALMNRVSRLTTGELDERACRAALANVQSRRSDGVTIERGDALEIYRRHARNCDLVVLDPPRKGCEELAQAMKNGRHRAILYISCNPVTLERDLRHLKEGGYRVTEATGFDMFPQTRHMEAAVFLER